MNTDEIYILTKKDKNSLKLIFDDYVSAFPEEERKSKEHLEKLLENQNYELLFLQDLEKEKIFGYAFLLKIKKTNILWLDFIAIKKIYQNNGYGKILFNKILSFYEKDFDYLFLEVEIPEKNNIDQHRRLKFYKNLGTEKINMDYRLPIANGSMPMYFLYKNIKSNVVPSNEILLKSIKEAFNFIHSDIKASSIIYDLIASKFQC